MILKKPLFIAKQWEFKHTTTSPLYPQANKLMEKSVQTVKNLLIKANHDPYLGLLGNSNTHWWCRLTSTTTHEYTTQINHPNNGGSAASQSPQSTKNNGDIEAKILLWSAHPTPARLSGSWPGQRTHGKLLGNNGGKNCRNRKMLMKPPWTKLMYSLNYTLMLTFCRSLKKKLGEVFQWSKTALEGQIIHIWIITTIQQYIHSS